MDTTTEPHPPIPEGPWSHFADCPSCGAQRGFPCASMTTGKPRVGAHIRRKLDEECRQCGERPGKWRIDPYSQDVENTVMHVFLCDECTREREEDI
jgi:hypothetical protein